MNGHMESAIHDLKLLITPFYVLVALAIFWSGRKATDLSQKVAVYSLTTIFVLCDLAGYAGPALNLPQFIVAGAHLLLPIACLAFILTNQPQHLFGRSGPGAGIGSILGKETSRRKNMTKERELIEVAQEVIADMKAETRSFKATMRELLKLNKEEGRTSAVNECMGILGEADIIAGQIKLMHYRATVAMNKEFPEFSEEVQTKGPGGGR